MKIKEEFYTSEHWKEVNEEVVVTSDGEEIVNYIFVFNTRFNLNDLVTIEESSVLNQSEKAIALAEGYEYTDVNGLGVLVRFSTRRGDIYYQGAAINEYD